jgi:hypothetical protein
MPLMLQENFTVKLLEMLRTGEIDCAILAEPFPDTGLAMAPLYDEPFMAALPSHHPLAGAEVRHRRSSSRRRPCCCWAPATAFATMCWRSAPSSPASPAMPRASAQLRGLVAGNHQAHGGRRHGRDAGAAPVGAQGGAGRPSAAARTKTPLSATCRSPTSRRRAAHAARGAGLAAQLYPLRGHRRLAQCDLRLRTARRVAPVLSGRHGRGPNGHGRDLTGYEDGTENPEDAAAEKAALAHRQGAGLNGSSFVAVQQWVHDLDAFESMGTREQDNMVGRRRRDNHELDDAPASAHVKRTAQESFKPEAFVLRRSMPWAYDRQYGLMFVAFGKSFDAFEAQMRRMAGLDDGIVDAMFQISRPVTGAHFWCPPVRQDATGMRLDLRQMGL